MSVGATYFTSSGSNGGSRVLLMFPPPFFGRGGEGFFPYASYAKNKVNAAYA